MGYPSDHFKSAVLAVYPPAPHGAPSASSLAGENEELKSYWLYVSTALQQLKYPSIISIILFLNPKHSTVAATRKKINYILAETRTRLCICFHPGAERKHENERKHERKHEN